MSISTRIGRRRIQWSVWTKRRAPNDGKGIFRSPKLKEILLPEHPAFPKNSVWFREIAVVIVWMQPPARSFGKQVRMPGTTFPRRCQSLPATDANDLYIIRTDIVAPAPTHWDNAKGLQTLDNKQYEITCCDFKSGNVLWNTPIGRFNWTSPLVVNGIVFAFMHAGDQIEMFDAHDGRSLGSAAVNALHWSSPSVAHGKLFVHVQRGVVCYDLEAPRADARNPGH